MVTKGPDPPGAKGKDMECRELDPVVLSKKRRTWFVLFSLVVALIFLAGNLLYGTVLATRNHRDTCLSCHETNKPPIQWEPSTMHPTKRDFCRMACR